MSFRIELAPIAVLNIVAIVAIIVAFRYPLGICRLR